MPKTKTQAQATTRLVRLQFNQKGAWRNAIDFNASDADQAADIMLCGAHLARAAGATARIATADGMQLCIASWNPDIGWHDPKTGKGL